MTIEELIEELQAVVDQNLADMDSHVMLDITGRWTGIKGSRTENDGYLLLIESED